MPNKPVKIIMLTGYLGAGKTTLPNHILANDGGIRGSHWCVLVSRTTPAPAPP